ncbi:MAG: hypothetical protein NC131_01195 [Roseburia sp.]|nr:hypothetical protein [Roseburia sp.]
MNRKQDKVLEVEASGYMMNKLSAQTRKKRKRILSKRIRQANNKNTGE